MKKKAAINRWVVFFLRSSRYRVFVLLDHPNLFVCLFFVKFSTDCLSRWLEVKGVSRQVDEDETKAEEEEVVKANGVGKEDMMKEGGGEDDEELSHILAPFGEGGDRHR